MVALHCGAKFETEMTLNEPKIKKNCRLKPDQPLPIITTKSGNYYKFRGDFNGFSVIVTNEYDMKKLISMGYFGKATLSRNFPNFQAHKPEIIRKRVFRIRDKHCDTKDLPQKVIVLPNSDSESDDYFVNLKPEFQLDRSRISENAMLGLEEAFFLSSAIKCLDVYHYNKILEIDDLWTLFRKNDKYFVQNYVAYHYFRSKNWVVKPGIKFGGDFLLYKQGPPFYHASYVVIISNVEENFRKIGNLNRRSMENSHLMGLQRLCETAAKELLICDIIWPSSLLQVEISPNLLSNLTIKETIMKRWISSQERQT